MSSNIKTTIRCLICLTLHSILNSVKQSKVEKDYIQLTHLSHYTEETQSFIVVYQILKDKGWSWYGYEKDRLDQT